MAKNVDGFSAALWHKYRVWCNYKRGCPPVEWGRRGCSPSPPTQFRVSVSLPIQSGVSGWKSCYCGVWGHFLCPNCCQMRENTASTGKQVARSTCSTLRQKRSKVWVQKLNGGRDICRKATSVGNGKNYEKYSQYSKG